MEVVPKKITMSESDVDRDVVNENTRNPSPAERHLPTYRYSREELFEISYNELSKIVPKDITNYRNDSETNWSFLPNISRGNSPVNAANGRERKKLDIIERDIPPRQRSSDPRERLKEEKDGIVLSPQRRSFNTGCHVQPSTLLRTGSGRDSRDSDRDNLIRDRRRSGNTGRPNSDKDHDTKLPRDHYVRDMRRKEDRRIERKDDQRLDIKRDDMRSDRYPQRDLSDYNRRRNERRPPLKKEIEPEWFTDGPTSLSDTIELRGFDKIEDVNVPSEGGDVNDPSEKVDFAHASEETVEDINGDGDMCSANTDISPQLHDTNFDLNDFFSSDIPGLSTGSSNPPDSATMESRFSQWFNAPSAQAGSREHSRQSSVTEDFTLINDIINVISHSPELDDPVSSDIPDSKPDNHTRHMSLDTGFSNFHTTSQVNENNQVNEPTNHLKALLFGNKPGHVATNEPQQSSQSSFLTSLNGNVKTLEELEAGMRQMSLPSYPQEGGGTAPEEDGDMTAFNKLLRMMKANATASFAADSTQLSNIHPEHSSVYIPGIPPKETSPAGKNEFWQAVSRNKEQQIQLQQQAIKQIKGPRPPPLNLPQPGVAVPTHQSMPPSATTPATPLTPATHETLINLIKQQQHQNLIQTPLTPHSISPLIHAQFLQQPPPSPRNPSPIMFSQQPPLNLNAPAPVNPTHVPCLNASSPINPNQLTPATQLCLSNPSPVSPIHLGQPSLVQNLNPNTLAVSSNNHTSRVPSPQELILHAQAIMHKALIKKQLVEQKERFNKKQQERSKSPNTNIQPLGRQVKPQGFVNPVLPTISKPNVPASFLPTAVIRKMQSDRADEKEKIQKLDIQNDLKMDEQDMMRNVASNGNININPTLANDIKIQIESASTPGSHSSTPCSMTHAPLASLPCPLPEKAKVIDINEDVKENLEKNRWLNMPPPNIQSHLVGHQVPPPVLLAQNTPSQSMQYNATSHSMMFHNQVPINVTSAAFMSQQNLGLSNLPDDPTLQPNIVRVGRPVVGSRVVQAVPIPNPVANNAHLSGRPIVKGPGGPPLQSNPHQPNSNVLLQMPKVDGGHLSQRPVIGGVTMNTFEVAKLLEQHRQMSTQSRPANPLMARMPLQPNVTNPLLVQPNMNPAPINQPLHNSVVLGHFPQLAALQQQQPNVNTIRNMYPQPGLSAVNPRTGTGNVNLANPSGLGRSMSSQVSIQNNMLLSGHNTAPNSLHQPLTNLNDILNSGNNQARVPRDANLSKWFGTDLLSSNSGVAFPPGKKIMTVDEIEQNQPIAFH